MISNIKIPTDNGKVGLILMTYQAWVATQGLIISDEHQAFEWVGPETAAERPAHKYPKVFTSKFAQ